jgi:hypothetical protein
MQYGYQWCVVMERNGLGVVTYMFKVPIGSMKGNIAVITTCASAFLKGRA